ncbi:hypothetical protein HanHA300_Chr16g0590931 [Helianthus annuus]|nr:hypothetical protein HanHA300_Chr16g0590931 [Helianthus annuus]KAJ0458734.1 hypothetical protein HanHA89_Chr16g0641151 [Helianthus annuus]KAJ0639279.1 hypothetical protein HanLR1_Chr16g0602161 [Helianthus annuus]
MSPVKREIIDESAHHDEQQRPPNKRSKQHDNGANGYTVAQMQFNPLDEPSPLGLRLRKTPSLLDLIQMRLSEGHTSSKAVAHATKDHKTTTTAAATDKLKASNFPASLLKIGTWEYTSKHEGDLVAKCYFAKHKLVWEVLDGGLKNKIEIQWSDITALKATYPDDGPGTLDIVLTRQPLFFRETNPQPRKHTLWQATSDFTGGQASKHRRHILQCPQGLLGKHYEKLIQCDPRLNFLSQQIELALESPYFEKRRSVFDEPNESIEHTLSSEGPTAVDLRGTTSSGGQSSSSRSEFLDPSGGPSEFLRETPSPSSVMDTSASEETRTAEIKELTGLVPGLHPSMSMSDLVNHIENQITKNRTPGDQHPLSHEEQQSLHILEDISRCLFNDSQYTSTSDEKSIMSRVDSLCCLLQTDPTTVHDTETDNGYEKGSDESNPFTESGTGSKVPEDSSEEAGGNKTTPGIPRNDSVGELLLNLPRIASLPRFFFNI